VFQQQQSNAGFEEKKLETFCMLKKMGLKATIIKMQ